MMKRILALFGIFCSVHLNAQTGIGTTTPHASAKLEVASDKQGFLPPRVTLNSATDNTTILTPAEGLLVYNKGSVGLQAGYYYWNGANWATIATATSAGNGVTSMDMVKLYGEAHSKTSGKIGNSTTGYAFTVPVSGRYLFDFTSSATALNGGTNTIYFTVRQGTTVLGSDNQSSYNNNVHVEYNGKVEVNLQAGVNYNVYNYATSGSFEGNDYDRVYYKLVAGNLSVTGQSVDYVSVSTISQSAIGDNRDLIFTSNNGGNIPYNTSTGVFTLSANKTYLFQAQIRSNGASSDGSYIEYGFVDAASNTLLVNGTQTITSSTTRTSGFGSNPVINFIYTPTSNQTVKLRTTATTVGTQNITSGTANITQIGSSAIINPWTLSGTNTYNTTGNVGIGTSAPTSRLNIVGGGIKIHNGFSRLNSRPLLNTSSIGNYEIRGVGSITGNTQQDLGDDGFLRLSAGGGSDTLVQSSIDISGGSDNTNMDNTIIMRTSGVERLRIDNNGNVNMNGSISLGNPTGNVVIKAAGFVGRGTDITLGNLKVRFAASGNMSLQVSSSSGTISTIGSDQYITNGSGSTTISRSVTASPIYLWPSGINFVDMGNSETCILIDTNTKMSWRIIGIVGPGYLNNFISIERIL